MTWKLTDSERETLELIFTMTSDAMLNKGPTSLQAYTQNLKACIKYLEEAKGKDHP